MTTIRVGTCGFGTRHAEYYDAFDVVEFQPTMSRPPPLAAAQRWRAEAPDGFEFTLKALAAITHPPRNPAHRRSGLSDTQRARCGDFRDTPVVRKAWKTTLELAHALEARLVILPCPASFTPTDENIGNLTRFVQWAHRDRIKLGWEPRGIAWTDEIVGHLCRELSLTHVVDPFQRPCMRPRPPYYRLHGISGHQHEHTDDELAELRERCSAELTYCLFKNASMAADARRFKGVTRSTLQRDTRGSP